MRLCVRKSQEGEQRQKVEEFLSIWRYFLFLRSLMMPISIYLWPQGDGNMDVEIFFICFAFSRSVFATVPRMRRLNFEFLQWIGSGKEFLVFFVAQGRDERGQFYYIYAYEQYPFSIFVTLQTMILFSRFSFIHVRGDLPPASFRQYSNERNVRKGRLLRRFFFPPLKFSWSHFHASLENPLGVKNIFESEVKLIFFPVFHCKVVYEAGRIIFGPLDLYLGGSL